MNQKMAVRAVAVWLLLVGMLVTQHSCQHWSYGLSPGGKRELEGLPQSLGNVVEEFPPVDPPCSVLGGAEESPLARIYRMKGFLASVFGLFDNESPPGCQPDFKRISRCVFRKSWPRRSLGADCDCELDLNKSDLNPPMGSMHRHQRALENNRKLYHDLL